MTTDTPPLVFVDVETTGLNPRTRRPWEIALIRRRAGLENLAFHWVVENVNLAYADPGALAVGGFFDRHPAAAGATLHPSLALATVTSERDIAYQVMQLTAGATLVGVNVRFDAEVLEEMLRRCGYAPGWHHHVIDMTAAARGYMAPWDTDLRPPLQASSIALSRACGVDPPDPDDAHTALADADWARRWYDRLFTAEY